MDTYALSDNLSKSRNYNETSFNISKEIWNNIWKKDPYAQDDLRKVKAKTKVDLLLNHIAPSKNWHVVEFGCGTGYICEELFKKIGCNVIGIDFSDIAIEKAKRRLIDYPVRFICSDIFNTNIESNTIDMVVCCGIIEHILNVNALLNEVRRILKPGGFIFIISTNIFSFIYPHRKIKQALKIWNYGYQKNWSHKALKSLLTEHGYSILFEGRIIYMNDLKLIGLLDNPFSIIFNSWGRYMVFIGRI